MTGEVDYPTLVKGIREARGLTQEHLARELGVTFGTVNGWENGKHRPIPALGKMLVNLARSLDVSVPLGKPLRARGASRSNRGKKR